MPQDPVTGSPRRRNARTSQGDDEELRCACGSLLARYVAGGVELKCRRCKSAVILPIDGAHTEVGC